MAEIAETGQNMRHPVRYRLEAAGAWLLYHLFRCLPLDVASALGGALGAIAGVLWIHATARARHHLQRAMPELSPGEVRRILRAMWSHLGRNVAELAHLERIGDRSQPDQRIEVIGMEHIHAAMQSDRAVLFFSGHIGNWDCLPLLDAGPERVVAVVHREANNPLVEGLLARGRSALRVELVPKGARGARRLLRLVKAKYLIGMLVDQKLNDGIAVPFFGRDAMTAPALAQFALHYDLAVLPMRCERLSGARFKITISPPLEHPKSGDRDADILTLMTGVNRILERWIRELPAQWLWMHRRWPSDD